MLAPDDLFPTPAPVRRGPPSEAMRAHLTRLRDETIELASRGRYLNAAGREWGRLPGNWRMALLLIVGIGSDSDNLITLASRDWREMPQPEREQLQAVAREAKLHLGRLTALAARV